MSGGRAELPASGKLKLEAYEDWIAAGTDDYAWPEFDERAASSLCYTSGTTGNPKGVVFVNDMPMTATGKILKAKLREQYWHRLG